MDFPHTERKLRFLYAETGKVNMLEKDSGLQVSRALCVLPMSRELHPFVFVSAFIIVIGHVQIRHLTFTTTTTGVIVVPHCMYAAVRALLFARRKMSLRPEGNSLGSL